MTATDESTSKDAAAAPAVGREGSVRSRLSALRHGDVGSLPVLVGLVLIAVIFQSLNSTFLDPFNLVNLCFQIAALGIIATGVTLVLLLGEIDLSVGSVSGLSAAVLATLNVVEGVNPLLSVLAAALGGLLIGALHGLVFTKIGIPSFIVTLAGLLVWQGAQLQVLGTLGTINLPPNGILQDIGRFSYLTSWQSYLLAALIVGLYLFSALSRRISRQRAELPTESLLLVGAKASVLAAALFLVVFRLLQDRGVPWIFVVFLLILLVIEYVLRRTRYGRALFAIGGNIEAARRAGLKVDLLRISVFSLASMLAAVGGVVAAMRLGFANQGSGAGDTLINAIAAAVIGGTSLFGGRSRLYSALLGALIIGSIANGLELLNLTSAVRYMITGSVLLVAVGVDALTQRSSRRAGR